VVAAVSLRAAGSRQPTDDSRIQQAVAFISDGLERQLLSPTIDAVFGLTNIRDAYTHLESNGQVGKVVVSVPTSAGSAECVIDGRGTG